MLVISSHLGLMHFLLLPLSVFGKERFPFFSLFISLSSFHFTFRTLQHAELGASLSGGRQSASGGDVYAGMRDYLPVGGLGVGANQSSGHMSVLLTPLLECLSLVTAVGLAFVKSPSVHIEFTG